MQKALLPLIALCMSSWAFTATAAPGDKTPPNLTLGHPSHGLSEGGDIPDASKIPYLRIASWDVGQLHTPGVADSEKDLYAIAEVIARFDAVVLLGDAPQGRLSQILDIVGTLTSVSWFYSALPPLTERKQARLAILWRSDRVKGTRAGPDAPQGLNPSPISLLLSFKGHPFVLGGFQVQGVMDPVTANAITGYVAEVLRTFRGTPVIFGCGCSVDHNSPQLQALRNFMTPAVTSGGTLIRIGGGDPVGTADNLWTNISTPFRSGVIPAGKILGMENRDVALRVSPHSIPFITLPMN